MRAAYLGNFKHPFCTESHIKAALESLGHEVIPIQEDEATWDEMYVKTRDVDLFLWTRTPGMLKLDGFKMLQAIKCPKASYHLDLYIGISREQSVQTDPFFYTDYMFSADGDPASLAKFMEYGVNAIWMPPATNKELCIDGEYKDAYAHDVVFVGSHGRYHQEWDYRPRLIEFLRKYYDGRLGLYPNPETPIAHGQVLRDICASAKVVVGDSLCMNHTHSNYWSNRVPETTGRAGLLVHPKIQGLEGQYEYGKHFVAYDYGDFSQLKETIDYYIANEDERNEIRRAGQEHTRAHHTFDLRMKEVFKVMGLN
jgi:hypothetical protein